jgi:hypothetical protein
LLVSFTCGGALRINNFCPGIDFLDSLGFNVYVDRLGVDVAMRHAPFYQGRNHSKVDTLYPFNGFIPYWMVIYLKESCDAFGIKTSGLNLPQEMIKR